jgi:hypothetical protein
MVDGQRQSYYGPTRADALAGRERAANHDHRRRPHATGRPWPTSRPNGSQPPDEQMGLDF